MRSQNPQIRDPSTDTRAWGTASRPCTLPSLDRPSGIPSGGTTLLLRAARVLDLPVLETPNPRVGSSGRSRPVPGPKSWHAFLLQRYTAPFLSGSLGLPAGAPPGHSCPVRCQESGAIGPIRTPRHGLALQHASFSMLAEQPVWIVQAVRSVKTNVGDLCSEKC